MDKEKKVLLGLFGVLALAAIVFAGWMIVQNVQDANKERYVLVDITMQDGGVIRVELDRQAAPRTVDNFVKLANNNYYDGLTFHRIISGFMIQGGDPSGDGSGGPGYQIKGEFSSNGWTNPIEHKRGVISMARSDGYDTAGSQFFIVHEDYPSLNGNYAAFGHVISGMDVVDRIAAMETGPDDMPLTPVVIASIRVVAMSNDPFDTASGSTEPAASSVSASDASGEASGTGASDETSAASVSGTGSGAASQAQSTSIDGSSADDESGSSAVSGAESASSSE